METHIGKVNVQLISSLMLTIGCWILLSAPALGQSAGDPAKLRMQEMVKRELQLTGVGREDQKSNAPKRVQAIMDQVSQDFQRILKLHNEIVRAIGADSPLNYQFISDSTGEIKKRATRLQATLELHKPESPAHLDGLKITQTKDNLIMLCRKIESFIRNPIIETPGTVDAEQLDKARRDLEMVVELSGAIKKGVDRQKGLP